MITVIATLEMAGMREIALHLDENAIGIGVLGKGSLTGTGAARLHHHEDHQFESLENTQEKQRSIVLGETREMDHCQLTQYPPSP